MREGKMTRAKTKTAKYFLTLSFFAALMGFCSSSSSSLKEEKAGIKVLKSNNGKEDVLENNIVISVVNAEIDTIYEGYTSIGEEIHYVYELPSIKSYSIDQALITYQVRTNVHVETQQDIRFVVRHSKGTLAWNLPSKVGQTPYFEASRTLCLDGLDKNFDASFDSSSSQETITVAVSSSNPDNSTFSLQVALIKDFQINLGSSMFLIQNVSFLAPAVRYIGSNDSSDKVLYQVRVNSDDDVCALVSIQEFSCPFYDTINSIRSKGNYQTMLRSATFNYDWSTYRHSEYARQGAYIILMVLQDNSLCETNSGGTNIPDLNRYKNFTVSVTNHISRKEVGIGIGISLGFMSVITLVVIIISICRWKKEKKKDVEKLMDTLRLSYTKSEIRMQKAVEKIVLTGYRSLVDGSNNDLQGDEKMEMKDLSSNNTDMIRNYTTSRSTNTDVTMKEMDEMMKKESSNQTKKSENVPKYLIDLATKSSNGTKNNSAKTTMFQKSSLYVYIVLMMGLFYGIPAIQLVINYQKDMSDDGNQDICFFNFQCSIPLGAVMDFNHIFSNVFYLWFGVLFLILVASKECRRKQLMKNLNRKIMAKTKRTKDLGIHDMPFGIPEHYGIFYAMGCALIIEGVLSSCYHVCPTTESFQFDTTFMYVMGILSFIKVYQFRHPDVSSNAHKVFLSIGLVLVVEVCGIYFESTVFWAIFLTFYFIIIVLLSLVVYHSGTWALSFKALPQIWQQTWNFIRTRSSKYFARNRLCLVIALQVLNAMFFLYGAINAPGISSFLLFVFIGNLLVYVGYYMGMKMYHKEKILKDIYMYGIFSLLCWIPGLYFFVSAQKSTDISPAESRNINAECVFLNIYDNHDIWHICSAGGLFCCFLLLLNLDDGVFFIPQNQLYVF